jgi:ribosome-associated protein
VISQDQDNRQDETDDGYYGPSKSALKRESHSLQKMGETLADLPASVLKNLPLPDNLREAIAHLQGIRSRGAARRQRQYLGKLMRSVDPEPIQAALEAIDLRSQRERNQFHAIERWRDRFVQEGESVATEFIDRYPATDRQRLRSLARSVTSAVSDDQRGRAARALFKFLREVMLTAPVQANNENSG